MPRGKQKMGRGMRGGSKGFGRFRNFDHTESFSTRLAKGGLYRSRNGRLLGVCQGVADYLNVRVSMVRILTVIAFLFTGIWPVGILYLVAAALLKPEPATPFANDDEREFYDSYAGSRTGALARLKRRFEGLDRRIRRMEDVVTSRDFQWEQKLKG